MTVRVQREDFDLGREVRALHENRYETGAVASFVGLVRDVTDGRDLSAMTLEHYPGMTEKQLEKIEVEARERWPLQDVLIIHRYGRLEPGEQIVLCATASAHRGAAFESCQFIMDWLKTKAPFWKLEEDEAGGGEWVDARDSDDEAAARWNQS